jgi:hypothetical protein
MSNRKPRLRKLSNISRPGLFPVSHRSILVARRLGRGVFGGDALVLGLLVAILHRGMDVLQVTVAVS